MKTYFEKQYKNLENVEEIDNLSKKLDSYIDLTGKIEINGYNHNNCEIYKSYMKNKLDKKMIKLYKDRSKTALTVVYGSRLNRIIQRIKSYFRV